VNLQQDQLSNTHVKRETRKYHLLPVLLNGYEDSSEVKGKFAARFRARYTVQKLLLCSSAGKAKATLIASVPRISRSFDVEGEREKTTRYTKNFT